jgi:hypothetical protein
MPVHTIGPDPQHQYLPAARAGLNIPVFKHQVLDTQHLLP